MLIFTPNARSLNTHMTFVDFTDYGIENSLPIDCTELIAIKSGADYIYQEFSAQHIDQLVDQWETALRYHALGPDALTDDWFTRALLCIALRGMRGQRRPKFFCLQDLE